jgi:hypothetical protein
VSDRRWPRFSQLQWTRDQLREITGALTDKRLADILRLAGLSEVPLEEGPGIEVADGYPRRSSGMGDMTRGSSEDTSTERAALHDDQVGVDDDKPDDWRVRFDAVDELVARFVGLLSEAHGAMRDLDKARIHIDGHLQQNRGRIDSIQGECECCGKTITGLPKMGDQPEDRKKAGFCTNCYAAWVRAGRPVERPDWIRQRKKYLKSKPARRSA